MNPSAEFIDDLRLLEPPPPWTPMLWLVGALLLCAIAAWWFIRRRRAHAASRMAAVDAQHAPEDALAELEKLFDVIAQERSRPYAIESSAIIRRYIERRFSLRAPQRSTEEFLAEARNSPKLAEPHQRSLGEFLRCCDLLKFARTSANRAELEALQQAAVDFVRETRATPPTQLAT
jgi:hypothetical protein